MQSGKRRQIQNASVFQGMKNRLGEKTGIEGEKISDKNFIIFVDTLTVIPEGPPIKTFDDIYTTPENILTDNMTLYINKFPNIEELTINP